MAWNRQERRVQRFEDGDLVENTREVRETSVRNIPVWQWVVGGVAAAGLVGAAMTYRDTEGVGRPAVESTDTNTNNDTRENRDSQTERDEESGTPDTQAERVETQHPYVMRGTDGNELTPQNALAGIHLNAEHLQVDGVAVPVTAMLVVNGVPEGNLRVCDGSTCTVLDSAIQSHGGGGGILATGQPTGEGLYFPIPASVTVDGVEYPVAGHATIIITPEGGTPRVFAVPADASGQMFGDPE